MSGSLSLSRYALEAVSVTGRSSRRLIRNNIRPKRLNERLKQRAQLTPQKSISRPS
jgi:hypothetical protein